MQYSYSWWDKSRVRLLSMVCLLVLLVSSASLAVVVDEKQAAWAGPSQYWHQVNGYGADGDMVWTWDNGASVCNSMTWHSGLGGGRYQISVFIPSNYAYTTNARYRIQDFRGGNATQLNEVDVNQAVIYGAWVDLGTYDFSGEPAVYLGDDTGEAWGTKKIGFDEVSFTPVYVPPPPPQPTGFDPQVISVTAAPASPTMGNWYDVRIVVRNNGDTGGNATIVFGEITPSGLPNLTRRYSPGSPPCAITQYVAAHGTSTFSFSVQHRWDWISAPDRWYVWLGKSALSLIPVSAIKQEAIVLKSLRNILDVESTLSTFLGAFTDGYDLASGVARSQAGFGYQPQGGTTAGIGFYDPVTVTVPQSKRYEFYSSTACTLGADIIGFADSTLVTVAAQVVLLGAARGLYVAAYDPDPDYTVLPVVTPIDFPGLDAQPDSPAKSAALTGEAGPRPSSQV